MINWKPENQKVMKKTKLCIKLKRHGNCGFFRVVKEVQLIFLPGQVSAPDQTDFCAKII